MSKLNTDVLAMRLLGIAESMEPLSMRDNDGVSVTRKLRKLAADVAGGVEVGDALTTEPVPPRAGSETMLAPYCVIGRSVVVDRMIDRSWKVDKATAEAHASRLLAQPKSAHTEELYVVKVVSVVRRRRNHEVIDIA